jgi:hypothetical protein
MAQSNIVVVDPKATWTCIFMTSSLKRPAPSINTYIPSLKFHASLIMLFVSVLRHFFIEVFYEAAFFQKDNQSFFFPSIMLSCLTRIFIIECICIYTLFMSFNFNTLMGTLERFLALREVEGGWLQLSAGVTADCAVQMFVWLLRCVYPVLPVLTHLLVGLDSVIASSWPLSTAVQVSSFHYLHAWPSFSLFHLIRTQNVTHLSRIRTLLFRLNQRLIRMDTTLWKGKVVPLRSTEAHFKIAVVVITILRCGIDKPEQGGI